MVSKTYCKGEPKLAERLKEGKYIKDNIYKCLFCAEISHKSLRFC